MGEIVNKVEAIAKPIIEKLGFELVDITYLKKVDGMELNISVFNPNGYVSIIDCEVISKALDEPLDKLNPTNDKPYNLVVGSMGLDRLMKTTKDFVRNLGHEVEIKLFKTLEESKIYIGTLLNVDDNLIEIKTKENKLLTITRNNIASAKLYIKF